jgi:hypothetical protein
MTQQVPDLLPPEEAFEADADDPAPIEILQTQGRLLGQRTKGEVRGEVEPVQAIETPTSAPVTNLAGAPSTLPPEVVIARTGGGGLSALRPGTASMPSGEEARFRFWFALYAPALNYRFRLFLVEHGEESYPLKIVRNRGGQPIVAKDREQFYERVRELLAEERTTKLVRQMRQLVIARILG